MHYAGSKSRYLPNKIKVASGELCFDFLASSCTLTLTLYFDFDFVI